MTGIDPSLLLIRSSPTPFIYFIFFALAIRMRPYCTLRSLRFPQSRAVWLQALASPLRWHSLFSVPPKVSIITLSRTHTRGTIPIVLSHVALLTCTRTLSVLCATEGSLDLGTPARAPFARVLASSSGSSQWFRVRVATSTGHSAHRASLTPCSPQHRSIQPARSPPRAARALPPKAPRSSPPQAHIRDQTANSLSCNRSHTAAPPLLRAPSSRHSSLSRTAALDPPLDHHVRSCRRRITSLEHSGRCRE